MYALCKKNSVWFHDTASHLCIHPPPRGGTNLPDGDRKSGPRLNIDTVFPNMGIPVLKIRRLRDRIILNMEIPILVRRQTSLYWDSPLFYEDSMSS